MQVSELSADQLDYWVARARGIDTYYPEGSNELTYVAAPSLPPRRWCPTRFWSQGGPIIEEARIDLNWDTEGHKQWSASMEPDVLAQGNTPLEAAMRAFVMARMGTDV
ncbi:MAG: DUF2591 family protein [Chromatiales bacterium]|nr:DUF2591 family protein [Chromatiales bacterium]MDX9767794.1 DUF2591 family protein [Ectothiorhodospiraceae bacterium]